MKLIDFTHHHELIELKKKVGAKDHEWKTDTNWQQLDTFELLSKLEKYGEADITLDKIQSGISGELLVGGRIIAAYIRDQYSHREYKFHVADCKTLKDARSQKRYDRYVAYTKTDGIFLANKIYDSGYIQRDLKLNLNVCRYCLSTLNYRNYRFASSHERDLIHDDFNLSKFFSEFKATNIVEPKYSDLTAPINNYTNDFRKIAEQVKAKYNYKCIDCNRDLSKKEYQRFLHVHHINSRKEDNRLENLEPVCISCHSEKPGHNLKTHPDYWDYKRIFHPESFGNWEL